MPDPDPVQTTTTTTPTPTPDAVSTTTNPSSVTTTTVKPGYRTTEFWLKILALILTALFASGVIPTSGPVAQTAAIAAAMLGAIGYTVCRTIAKGTATKATAATAMISRATGSYPGFAVQRLMLAIVVVGAGALAIGVQLVAFTGCATVKADARVMSGAFATCAKADLGEIVAGSTTTLIEAVTSEVASNASTLEADLTALAVKVGLDGVKCALAAVEAVLAPPSKPGAPPTTQAPPPGLLRARTWRKSEDNRVNAGREAGGRT